MKTGVRRFAEEHKLLVGILLVSLLLRLVLLNAVPSYIFDESYYVPAAHSILANWTDPNVEHPPLVKLVLAGSIALGGDNPITWRLPSVIAGLASIAFFYFIALLLSKEKRFAALCAAFLAFDPLHVLFSRAALLDIFMLAFALGGAYFMLRRDWTWAGVLFGLGFASKWPALLPFLAVTAYLRMKKSIKARDAARVLLAAMAVYLLVSLPFILQNPSEWSLSQINSAGKMSSLPKLAQQSSTAVEWLYLQKPVWFLWSRINEDMPPEIVWFAGLLGNTAALSLVAFGNPVFWIPGLLAVIWLTLNRTKKMSDVRTFALLWFLCTYVPFLLLPRTNMFIYYMLLVLPAYALALSRFLTGKKYENWYLVGLAVSIALLLPFVLGLPLPKFYFDALRPFLGDTITINFLV